MRVQGLVILGVGLIVLAAGILLVTVFPDSVWSVSRQVVDSGNAWPPVKVAIAGYSQPSIFPIPRSAGGEYVEAMVVFVDGQVAAINLNKTYTFAGHVFTLSGGMTATKKGDWFEVVGQGEVFIFSETRHRVYEPGEYYVLGDYRVYREAWSPKPTAFLHLAGLGITVVGAVLTGLDYLKARREGEPRSPA